MDQTNAMEFVEACETGQGWKGRADYRTPDATFPSQAERLAETLGPDVIASVAAEHRAHLQRTAHEIG